MVRRVASHGMLLIVQVDKPVNLFKMFPPFEPDKAYLVFANQDGVLLCPLLGSGERIQVNSDDVDFKAASQQWVRTHTLVQATRIAMSNNTTYTPVARVIGAVHIEDVK